MRQTRHLLAGLGAFALAALFATAALATSGIHIEWMRNGVVYGAQTITSSGSSVQSNTAPDLGDGVGGTVRVTVTAGAVVEVAGGPNPTATQTNGVRLAAGMAPITFSFFPGDKVAIIEATDQPPAGGGTISGTVAATQSGSWSMAATGAASDAADGQGTSATDILTVARLQGWNGTAWSRLRLDTGNNLQIGLATPAGVAAFIGAPADNAGASTTSLYTVGLAEWFDGVHWDEVRGNFDTGALITLASQAAGTVNSADTTNYNGRGLVCTFNQSAHTGTPSTTFSIQMKDAASTVYVTLLTSAAITADATPVTLTVYPGAAVTANVSANGPLPRIFRVTATVAGTSPVVTAKVGCNVID